MKEHHCRLPGGLEVALYREHAFPDEWCWRVVAAFEREQRTFTENLADAKRIALRGAEELFRQAAEQAAAERRQLGEQPAS